jgi:hypothetical protein
VSDLTKLIIVLIAVVVILFDLIFNRLRKLNNIPKPNVLRTYNFIYYINYWQKVKKEVDKKKVFKFLINVHLVNYVLSLLLILIIIILTILFILRTS